MERLSLLARLSTIDESVQQLIVSFTCAGIAEVENKAQAYFGTRISTVEEPLPYELCRNRLEPLYHHLGLDFTECYFCRHTVEVVVVSYCLGRRDFVRTPKEHVSFTSRGNSLHVALFRDNTRSTDFAFSFGQKKLVPAFTAYLREIMERYVNLGTIQVTITPWAMSANEDNVVE